MQLALMPPTVARSRFPGLADKTFLDAACVSLVPVDAQEAMTGFLDMAMRCDARDASQHHIAMDRMREGAIQEAARLLSAEPRHIGLVESTTHGLNIAAGALHLQPGDKVLVADTEFLQVSIPWSTLPGVEVRPVRSRDGGALLAEDFERAMDERTRAVSVSSVQWCTGYRIDMRTLGEICRQKRVWLVVDAIQEVGAMRVDVSERYADFLIAGGHKWLNAPFGCGVLHISDRVLSELSPPSYGYLAMEEPEGGWADYFRTPSISPYRDFRFQKNAHAYEVAGTANYPGAVGLGAALRLTNAVGIEAVEAHIRRLTDLLRAELRRVGARLVTPDDGASRSGITVFRYFDAPAGDQALVEALLDEKVYVSMRYTSNTGGIRVSTHYYNNEDDVRRLIDALVRRAA